MDESDQVHIDQVKFQIQTRSSHQPTFQTGRAVRLALTPVRVLSTFVIGPATLSLAGFCTSGRKTTSEDVPFVGQVSHFAAERSLFDSVLF